MTATQRSRLDKDELQTLDAQFHLTAVRLAGNRFMLRALGVLNDVVAAGMETTLVAPGQVNQSTREHARIIEAIKTETAEAARTASRLHIRNAHAPAQQQVAREELNGEQRRRRGRRIRRYNRSVPVSA